MNCDKFIAKFAQAGISLEEFLTISDEKLKEIGIEMPFERNLIKLGIFNFHKAKWTNSSLYIPKNFMDEELSALDLVMICANVLRQLVVMKSHLRYIKELSIQQRSKGVCKPYTLKFLKEFQSTVETLKKKIRKQVSQTQSINPLMIRKKEKKSSKLIKFAAIIIVPVTFIGVIKIFRS
jgi:hypothetical protein